MNTIEHHCMVIYTNKDQVVLDVLQKVIQDHPDGIWLSVNDLRENYTELSKVSPFTLFKSLEKIIKHKTQEYEFVISGTKKIKNPYNKWINAYQITHKSKGYSTQPVDQEVLA